MPENSVMVMCENLSSGSGLANILNCGPVLHKKSRLAAKPAELWLPPLVDRAEVSDAIAKKIRPFASCLFSLAAVYQSSDVPPRGKIPMTTYHLHEELWLPLPRPQVFEFFADAGNLDAITPPWLNFHIVTPRPIEMRPGALIDYKLRVRGVPISWRTEIAAWDPPFKFVDQQLKGPYKKWVHTHTFEEKEGGTLIRDHVEYAVPGGILSPIVHRLFVKSDVEKIFKFRTQSIRKLMLSPSLASRESLGKRVILQESLNTTTRP